ncbi:MAG TPA: hypothetical protein VGL29_15185 [Blastocatellia bacterium]
MLALLLIGLAQPAFINGAASSVSSTESYPSSTTVASNTTSELVKSKEVIKRRARKYFSNIPLSFETGDERAGRPARFISRGNGFDLFFTDTETVIALDGMHSTAVLRMRPVGGNRALRVIGLHEFPGRSNYFIGNDPKKSRGITNPFLLSKRRHGSSPQDRPC